MRRTLLWKSLIVLGMALALLIPLAMIEGQIQSRSERQKEVVQNISETAAGRQQVVGPILVVSWLQWTESETLLEGRKVKEGGFQKREQILVPRTLDLDGQVTVEERYRGLYKAQLFHLGGTLKGTFALAPGCGVPLREPGVKLARATLVLGISDLRGVQNQPVLKWGGTTREFKVGGRPESQGQGIHVDLGPLEDLPTGTIPFEVPLQLMGTQTLSMAPVAEETNVTLHSPWADPSFGGRYLPTRRQVGPGGFEASWQVSNLARDLDAILDGRGKDGTQEVLAVSFIDSVNIYLQAERAVKYGLLFVGLTFAAFFLFELIRRLRIHPMQYFLVGLALALFFLLLISLSEHVPFLWAYVLASGASILLLGAYLVHVLGSASRGLTFGAGLVVLHAVLYGLLVSEDNALLMGAVLLFGSLAAVMMATRKLDWYGLGAEPMEAGEPVFTPPPCPPAYPPRPGSAL